MDQRRHRDAAGGGQDRQHGVSQIGQFAVVQLALELQADQQEKHRHQGIVDPVLDGQAGHVLVPETEIPYTQRRIGEQQRDDGADDEHDASRLARFGELLERFREFFFDAHFSSPGKNSVNRHRLSPADKASDAASRRIGNEGKEQGGGGRQQGQEHGDRRKDNRVAARPSRILSYLAVRSPSDDYTSFAERQWRAARDTPSGPYQKMK